MLKVVLELAGELVADHVYVRFPSPPMSSATTLSSVVVPVTGLGVAEAGTSTVGGVSETVTEAVPMSIVLAVARMDAVPEAFGAVYRPVPLMLPALSGARDQVNPGCVDIASPNWSSAVAVNCCVALGFRLTLAGVTLTVVSVCSTVTLTLLVVERVPSEI